MLINKKYFAQYSVLPTNYNYDDIMVYEPLAVSLWIEPVIGPYLLAELKSQIENNQLSPENSTLLTEGLLWQYLTTAMCYEGLPFLWARVNEIGITLGESDNYKSVDLKDLTYIQNHLRRILESLKEQVIQFLCSHCSSFKLFDTSICGGDCPCNKNKGLKEPNANWLLYSVPKKDVDIK